MNTTAYKIATKKQPSMLHILFKQEHQLAIADTKVDRELMVPNRYGQLRPLRIRSKRWHASKVRAYVRAFLRLFIQL